MTQAVELITDAYLTAGLLDPHEALTAERAQYALRRLNGLGDSWGLEPLMNKVTAETVAILGPGSSFTIGPTGDVTLPFVPVGLEGGGFFRNSNVDYPFELVSREFYMDIAFKSISSSYPQYVFYDSGITEGTAYVYPAMVGSLEVHLQITAPQVAFPDLTTDIPLPMGYADALMYSLCEILHMGKMAVPAEIAKAARTARDRIRSSNVQPGEMSAKSGDGGIYTGYFFR